MKSIVLLTIALLGTFLSGTGRATLIDNLDGTITQIRNDDSTLMWLQNANLAATETFGVSGIGGGGQMPYRSAADEWIAALNAEDYLGYSDWQLPVANPVNGRSYHYSISYDGSTDLGYNITSPNSPLAYMFYVELGNLGWSDTSGNHPQPGWGLRNSGPFTNLESGIYWTSSDYGPSEPHSLVFRFDYGRQGADYIGINNYAWAMRGDLPAPVPEPATILLIGPALLGLAGYRRWRKR